MWPYQNRFDEYVDLCGEVYCKGLDRPESMLTIQAAFQPALGSHRRREVTLMQRINRPEALIRLLGEEIRPEQRGPGTWTHDALDVRDRWASRLLRTSSWSPLY